MQTRDFLDYQCYIIFGNMRMPAQLVELNPAEIEEKEIHLSSH